MCGKFTSMASWAEVVAFSQPLIARTGEGSNDRRVVFRPMSDLPVIVFDRETQSRKIVWMRWGFPHPKNPKIPQPIHARAESIAETKAFRGAFLDGQRGIVIMCTFNECREVTPSKTEQWTIDPGDSKPRGFAFVWRRFEPEGWPAPLLACVMVTVPANRLIRDAIMQDVDDPRMPATLEDADWSTWLGEIPVTPDEAKTVLRTMEGVNWTIAPEPKPPKPDRPKRS